MPLLDTRSKDNNLLGKFISDIVLQILSFVSENERVNIKQRQKEGISSAKKRGVKFGRPSTKYTQNLINVFNDYMDQKISLENALIKTNLKKSNFYYHLKKISSMNSN